MTLSSAIVAHEILDVVPTVMRSIRTEMRSRRSADLSIPQFRGLGFLDRNPGASLSSLADFLGLTSPTVCKMIDGMVLNHLVSRDPSAIDRRKVILNLTPEGRAILEKARQGTMSRLTDLLAALSPDELSVVFQALQLLHPLFSPTGLKEPELSR
jgi:DNA-binding MarR family transcriptional regulator